MSKSKVVFGLTLVENSQIIDIHPGQKDLYVQFKDMITDTKGSFEYIIEEPIEKMVRGWSVSLILTVKG